jgi:hypothetical protein
MTLYYLLYLVALSFIRVCVSFIFVLLVHGILDFAPCVVDTEQKLLYNIYWLHKIHSFYPRYVREQFLLRDLCRLP